ncbi:MAG: DUF3786 domain-containing protein [Eubacteriaceae bacterium]|nr:DUF3786 domain-containing protein [Eubacteriaceae bacterium]
MDYQDNKDRIPLEHYRELFSKLDPNEASLRCAVPFNQESSTFELRLMGEKLDVVWPSGQFYSENSPFENPQSVILLLRYLCEGRYEASSGALLDYKDMPWGQVYYRVFEGRCLKRLAYGFGNSLNAFSQAMEKLGGEKLDMGDASYRFAFLDGLYIVFIMWQGDDEFPPSAQILFEDNIPAAFTAEDCAAVGDISISRLKAAAL